MTAGADTHAIITADGRGMKSLREIFESIAYAGMKPGAPSPSGNRPPPSSGLRARLDRFLNGSADSDPFYLTNRTTAQKMRLALYIAAPFVLVLTAVYLAATGAFDPSASTPPPGKVLTNAEIATKMLPNLDKEITLPSNKNVDVLSVVVQGGPASKISGTVRNNTSQPVTDVEVVFDLTNETGSRLGGVTCKVARVEAKGTAPFELSVPHHDAAYAIVREVHNQ
jgi:hypothetical protein